MVILDKFDLPAFHDLVLANGAVTMLGLEALVMEWVAELGARN